MRCCWCPLRKIWSDGGFTPARLLAKWPPLSADAVGENPKPRKPAARIPKDCPRRWLWAGNVSAKCSRRLKPRRETRRVGEKNGYTEKEIIPFAPRQAPHSRRPERAPPQQVRKDRPAEAFAPRVRRQWFLRQEQAGVRSRRAPVSNLRGSGNAPYRH